MFEYELHRMNHAQLVREAAAERLSHEAAESAGSARGLRRLGRRSAGQDAEGRVSDGSRGRFVRAA
ncbi:hypothetical protein OHB11_12015 [Streptomyces zaomyceticus]|uniref:hypothetical protein n=1 Tax=Streptomyces zaomyceticus TaxID=68286 RepID=UPI001676F247|nr:hypothetical protein [Streptomyces zaomyceticus]WSQ21301.1 hypothetical protein OG237_29700 [Streptomyces zaomyceticus]GHG04397.1 hypothetical protein GCM10018791_15660 [Streptomyces zaomyceticus]